MRKVGRVAALTKGLRHRGINLVRTVADLPAMTQLLGDRDAGDLDGAAFGRAEARPPPSPCSVALVTFGI